MKTLYLVHVEWYRYDWKFLFRFCFIVKYDTDNVLNLLKLENGAQREMSYYFSREKGESPTFSKSISL